MRTWVPAKTLSFDQIPLHLSDVGKASYVLSLQIPFRVHILTELAAWETPELPAGR